MIAQASPTFDKAKTVLLIVPPFVTTTRPSLAAGQLCANLLREGIRAEVLYLTFGFAERIGLDAYETLGETFSILFGEFIFSGALFGRSDAEIDRYLEQVMSSREIEQVLTSSFPDKSPDQAIRWLVDSATEFCRGEALAQILARDPGMIGFSSSFQQNCASLALMREIKRVRLDLLMVMGGANCEGEMGGELLKQFPQIDCIGQGECDLSFVEFVSQLRAGKTPEVAGFLSRAGDSKGAPPKYLRSEDLEQLPCPDFDDYFSQLNRSQLGSEINPDLLMEMSRGCWWGAKHHCTFCGLNGESMAFRNKSETRVVEEVNALIERYDISYFVVTDLIIDMSFFKTLLPRLQGESVAEFFIETKANLNRSQVRALATSGMKWFRPGIESLSDLSLELMRKGASKLTNIQLLKWSSEFGARPFWGYLFGFPGESEEELTEIARDIEAVHHLQPPQKANVIRLDRFSPFFEGSAEFGLDPVYTAEPYRHIYPLPEESLARIAYSRQSAFFAEKERGDAYKFLNSTIARWQKAFPRSYLLAIPGNRSLVILDTRPCARQLLRSLRNLERSVYEYCDEARGFRRIEKAFPDESAARLQEILDRFVADRLMLLSNGRYMSLAVDTENGFVKFATAPMRRRSRGNSPAKRAALRRFASTGGYRPWGRTRGVAETFGRLSRLVIALRLSPRHAVNEFGKRAAALTWKLVAVWVVPPLIRLLGGGRNAGLSTASQVGERPQAGESAQVSAG